MVPLNKFLQQMLQVIFNPQSNDVLFLNLRDFIHVFLLILLRNNRCTIIQVNLKSSWGLIDKFKIILAPYLVSNKLYVLAFRVCKKVSKAKNPAHKKSS